MRISTGRSIFVVLALAAPLGLAIAESPAPKSAKGHPNLFAAQKLVSQAFDKLEVAQKANEYDLGGHAAKAKALLLQAKAEITAATEAAGGDGTRKGKPEKADPYEKTR